MLVIYNTDEKNNDLKILGLCEDLACLVKFCYDQVESMEVSKLNNEISEKYNVNRNFNFSLKSLDDGKKWLINFISLNRDIQDYEFIAEEHNIR